MKTLKIFLIVVSREPPGLNHAPEKEKVTLLSLNSPEFDLPNKGQGADRMGGQGSSERLIDVLVQIIALSESDSTESFHEEPIVIPFRTDLIYLEVAVATIATITVYVVEDPSRVRMTIWRRYLYLFCSLA